MSFFRRGKKERELHEEIEAHLAIETQQRIDRGESPEEARANASRQFGNVALVMEVTRDSWRSRAQDRVVHDLRHVLRHTWTTFRREPGIVAVTMLTLALVLGANAMMFSAISTLMLRNRPGAGRPERLVDFVHVWPQGGEGQEFSYPNYLDYRSETTVFSGLAAYSYNEPAGLRHGKGVTELVRLAAVSGNYFQVLEIGAAAGRLLTEQDDRRFADPVAVISHRLWQNRFGRDPATIGASVVLLGRPFTIVGVTAESFVGTTVMHDDVWIPLALRGSNWLLQARDAAWLGIVGRLQSSLTIKEARAEIALKTANLQRHAENKNHQVRLVNRWYQGQAPEEAMKGLMVMSLLVLLVACANIAGIGLSRALVRQPEIAVRLALGAPRLRVALQLLWETIALFIPAAIVAMLLAKWTIRAKFCSLCGEPELDMSPDWRVAVFVVGLMLAAAAISTIAPAVQVTHTNLSSSLKRKSGGSTSPSLRLQGALIVAQVAASIMLIVVGSLYLRNLFEISSMRVFDPRNVNIASIQFDIGGLSALESQTFLAEVLERSSTLPGIVAISAARDFPQNDEGPTMLSLKLWKTGQAIIPDKPDVTSGFNGVTPGYFEALRIPIIKGRDFRDSEPAANSIAIVSESVASNLWPSEEAVGKTVYICADTAKCKVEIVGIAADDVRGKPSPIVYRPLEQAQASWAYLVFRGLDSRQAIPAVRKVLSETNPNLPVISILQMKDLLRGTFFYHYLIVWSAGILGLISAAMASIGIYGVASHAAASRTREIGIRTALGARRASVIRLIVRRSMILTIVGAPIGCATALFVARAIPPVSLYRVNDADPSVYLAGCVGILVVAFLASFWPARKAANSDPMIALRHE
jgi:predicted permease